MAKAPISCCIISRDCPHLLKTVRSIEPYVEQVVTVDTATIEGCHDREGRILDFSLARNKAHELATQPWVMWLDSDDLIVGAENLYRLCEGEPRCFLFPYEYAYDDLGRVLVRQYRERLAPNGRMVWQYPIHEVWVAKAPLRFLVCEDVIVKHQRQYLPNKPQEPGRNMRIISKWLDEHPDDVRNMYYGALEYSTAGDNEKAKELLVKYLERSGWDDERIMACHKLVQIYEGEKKYKEALRTGFVALEIGDWFENLYAISRQFYHLKNWERCAYYCRLALARPPTKTPLFVNETDRHELHVYLNYALNQLGDQAGAYESTLQGLAGNPIHPYLRHNKAQYEKHLGIEGPSVQLGAFDPKRMRIVFVTKSMERWDPTSIKQTGIGGSETMLAVMATRLAALGHEVTVYADPQTPGLHEGATWKRWQEFQDVTCDVLVVSRYCEFLESRCAARSRVSLLWCHDVFALGATQQRLALSDRLLALSSWHRGNLCKVHNLHPEKVIVTRNGIDLKRFEQKVERNPYRIVNSSSPDRSWPVLLELFPRIRERVPQAELHLYYGFDNWKKAAASDRLQMELIARLEHQVRTIPGVHYHGRVGPDELAKEFLRSGVWGYPTWFSETSCISAAEAKTAGLRGVTSNLAALAETGSGFTLIDGEWTDAEYQAKFVAACVEALTRADRPTYNADVFGLDPLAREWEAMLVELVEKKKTHPLTPYQPSREYQAA